MSNILSMDKKIFKQFIIDLNVNLLADTDTLDLVQDIFVRSEGVQETSIDQSDEIKF